MVAKTPFTLMLVGVIGVFSFEGGAIMARRHTPIAVGGTVGAWTIVKSCGSDKRGDALWVCVNEGGLEKILSTETLRQHAATFDGAAIQHLSDQNNHAEVKSRLLANVTATDTGCWEWNRFRDPDGYGSFSVCRQKIRTHVASYMVHVTPNTEGLCVLHKCDNPPCCNPDHLFLGTHADNSKDMRLKNRHRVKQKPVCDVVRRIREMSQAGHSRNAIAEITGLKLAYIRRVIMHKLSQPPR